MVRAAEDHDEKCALGFSRRRNCELGSIHDESHERAVALLYLAAQPAVHP